jgi:hypothetical protein
MLPWESKYIIGIFNSFHDLKLLNCIMWSHPLSYFDERNTRSLGVIWLKILLKFVIQTTKIFQGFFKKNKENGLCWCIYVCCFLNPLCLNSPCKVEWLTFVRQFHFSKTYLVRNFHKKEYSLNLPIGSWF